MPTCSRSDGRGEASEAHEPTCDHAVVRPVLTYRAFIDAARPTVRPEQPFFPPGALRPTRFITQNPSIPASLLSHVGGFDGRFSDSAWRISNWGCACPSFRYSSAMTPRHGVPSPGLHSTTKLDKVRRTGQHNLADSGARFPVELASLPLGRLVCIPGESPRWSNRLTQAAFTCPGTETLVRWVAGQLPDSRLNLEWSTSSSPRLAGDTGNRNPILRLYTGSPAQHSRRV